MVLTWRCAPGVQALQKIPPARAQALLSLLVEHAQQGLVLSAAIRDAQTGTWHHNSR